LQHFSQNPVKYGVSEEGTPKNLGFLPYLAIRTLKKLGFLPFLEVKTLQNPGFSPFLEYGSLKNLGFLPLEREEACIFAGFRLFLAPWCPNGLLVASFCECAKNPGFLAVRSGTFEK
jgi:hypothetical protein